MLNLQQESPTFIPFNLQVREGRLLKGESLKRKGQGIYETKDESQYRPRQK